MHTSMMYHLLLKIHPLMIHTLSLEKILQQSNCINNSLLVGYRIIRVLLVMVRVNININMLYMLLLSKL
jgi:hypothetical protein